MKRKQVVIIHITIWSLLLVSNMLTFCLNKNIYNSHQGFLRQFIIFFIIQAGYSITAILCFYSSYLFVAPEVFVSKRYLRSIFISILILSGIAGFRYVMESYFFYPVLHFDNYMGHHWPLTDFLAIIFFYYFPRYFIYGLMYFFVESWYNNKQLEQELKKEKINAELSFLRSQINPHFLFNTINDIYSLTYHRSPQAPDALLKLSEILRYMLREGNSDLILLKDEIQYLENVIDLQRISSKGHTYTHFELDGFISGQKVPSFLFIAFIENAFKHGILNDPENPVLIHMSGNHDNLVFFVSNKKNMSQKDCTRGIGLNNVRRRLELMYPDKYHLDISDNADIYTVKLVFQFN